MKIHHSDTRSLLTRDEMLTAIELMIARMDVIDDRSGNGFPLYSPGTTDAWAVSSGGSWVGGFWAGWWWLRARVTESMADRRKAAQICLRLSPKIHSVSINRSMIFWYGAALGDRWFGDDSARSMARESAAALSASHDPAMHCIPLGTDMGGGANGDRCISVDTLASTIDLLNYNSHGQAEDIARRQVDIMHAVCGTAEGAYHSKALYEQGAFRPTDQAGVWSRGQAWAMLGLSRAAAKWGEPYLSHARSACEYWLCSRPGPVPPSSLDQLSGSGDPSASLIAALSMCALAEIVPDGERWLICAHRQIATIVRNQYFTGLGEPVGNAAAGIFWGACYQTKPDKQELVESAWGSFFLMAALCILAGVIKPTDC